MGGSWLITLGAAALGMLAALVRGPERAWTWILPRWAHAVLRWSGVTLDVVGAERLATPAVILVNHVSFIDAVYPFAVLPPRTRLVTKRQMLWVPLVGWALWAAGAILIDRKKGAAAMAQIQAAVRALPPGWSVLFFPEGTRARGMTMLPFKRGAFQVAIESGLPLLPVGTAGQLDVVPGDGVVLRPGRLHITVGEPIPSAGLRPEQLAELMAQGREALQRCIDASLTRREQARCGEAAAAVS